MERVVHDLVVHAEVRHVSWKLGIACLRKKKDHKAQSVTPWIDQAKCRQAILQELYKITILPRATYIH